MIIAIQDDLGNTAIITIVTIIFVILITIVPIIIVITIITFTIVILITIILGESPAWRRTWTTRNRRWWLPYLFSIILLLFVIYGCPLLLSFIIIIVYYWWPPWGSWTRPALPPMTPREQRRFVFNHVCFVFCLFCFVFMTPREQRRFCFQSCLFVFWFCFYDSERAKKVLFSIMCRMDSGYKHQVIG